jgi:hypothetical protein
VEGRMNNSGVFFDRIDTDVSPKRCLKEFLSKIKPDRFETVEPGEMVEFTLPEGGNYYLTFSGVKPEKFDIVGNKLTVLMTESVIIFTYTILDLKTKLEKTGVEVVSAL